MVAVWQQRIIQFVAGVAGQGKRLSLALLLLAAVAVAFAGMWNVASAQESPLPTPIPGEAPPAEAPPAEVPPAQPFVPMTLPGISGVISDENGDPLPGIRVTAYRRQHTNWAVARQTTTNANGEYRFAWMPAATYRLLIVDPRPEPSADAFTDAPARYASTYYPNASDIEGADDLVVVGAALSGIDAEIAPGGSITGTLSWPDGPTPFDSTIELYYVTDAPIATRLNIRDDLALPAHLRQTRLFATQTFTDSVVNYAFTGLPPGRYRVCAEAISLRATVHECFDDAALGIHANDVVVTHGDTVANVAIEFGDEADLATLAGVVTLADESPAVGVDVEVTAAPQVDFFASPQPQRTTTDEAGRFSFDTLPFGRYVVRYGDADGLYLPSDYRATPDATSATVITLERSSEVTISSVISAASLITGSVILDGEIAGMGGQVTAFGLGPEGWFVGGTGNIVAATGVYTVAGLRGGTYRLQYTVDIPSSIFYGEPGATLETATEIEVMTGTSVGGIVMDLTPYLAGVAYGSISGMVVVENVPQAGLLVRVYDAGGDCCVAPVPVVVTETTADGRFGVTGLPPGRYKVGVSAADQPSPTLFAPDQRTFENAAVYTIGNPADGVSRQHISDVNVALGAVGSVARRVLRPDDSPVAGATANLYQRLGDPGNWPLVASTVTNEEGRYGFAGVVPDVYQVCLVVAGIAEPSCSGRGGQGYGLDVVVTAGQEATGIDILDVP